MFKRIWLFLFCFTLATGAELNKKRIRNFESETDLTLRNKLQKNYFHFLKEQLEIAWQMRDFEACKKLIYDVLNNASNAPHFPNEMNEIHEVLMQMKIFPSNLFNQEIRPYLASLLNDACLEKDLDIFSSILSIIECYPEDLTTNTIDFLFQQDLVVLFKALYESTQTPSFLIDAFVRAFPNYQPQAILNYFCPENININFKKNDLSACKKSLPNKKTKDLLYRFCHHGTYDAFHLIFVLRPYLILQYANTILFDVCNAPEQTTDESEKKLKKISYLLHNNPNSFDYTQILDLYAKNKARIGLEEFAPFLQPIDHIKATQLFQTGCVSGASADFFRLLLRYATGFVLDSDVATEMLHEAIINKLPIEVIMFLIDSGVDIQACYTDADADLRGNILHLIAEYNGEDINYVKFLTKLFIDRGANVSTENYLHDTPLMTAIDNSNLPCIEELIQYPAALTRNSQGNSIFHILLDSATDYSESYDEYEFMQSHAKYLQVWKFLLAHLSLDTIRDLLFSPNNAGMHPIQNNRNRPLSDLIQYLLEDCCTSSSNTQLTLLELLEKSKSQLHYVVTLQPVDRMISRSIASGVSDGNHEDVLNVMSPDIGIEVGTFNTWMRLRHALPLASLDIGEIQDIVKVLYTRMEAISQKLHAWEDQQAFNNYVAPLLKTCSSITTTKDLMQFYEACKTFVLALMHNANYGNIKSIQGTCYKTHPWKDPYYEETDRRIGWERKRRWCFYDPEHLFLSLFFTSDEIYELCLVQIRTLSENNMKNFILLINEEYDITQLRDKNGSNILYHALSRGNVPFSMYLIAHFSQMLMSLNLYDKKAMNVFACNAMACKKLVEIAQYERLTARALAKANAIINEKKEARSIASCFDQTFD